MTAVYNRCHLSIFIIFIDFLVLIEPTLAWGPGSEPAVMPNQQRQVNEEGAERVNVALAENLPDTENRLDFSARYQELMEEDDSPVPGLLPL